MSSNSIKWLVGAVGVPFVIVLISSIYAYQGYIDGRQDKAISETKQDSVALFQETQKNLKEVSDNGRKTAEALSQVATTLKEIDTRGSMALRDHEKLRDGGVH